MYMQKASAEFAFASFTIHELVFYFFVFQYEISFFIRQISEKALHGRLSGVAECAGKKFECCTY